jgi:putative tricarboxylic transport membrane protein
MRAADLVTASVLMLLGSIILFDAARLGFGWGTDGPQSGFFPFWLAVIMQALWRNSGKAFVARDQLASVLKVFLPAAAMAVLTHYVGLYVAAALYMGFYMRWAGRHSWVAVAALSISIPVLAFLIFELWFFVPMPKGPLENWLGY